MSNAVRTGRIIRAVRGDAARLERLLEASYALHSSLDLDELLGLILRTAADGVGARRGTVFLLRGDKLWSKVLSGDEALEIELPVGQGLAGTVAQTGECICIDDAYSDPRFDRSWDERSGFRTEQVLCAPIKDRAGKIVGVFQLLNSKGGGFGQSDQDFLAGLSIHAALAVENAQLHSAMIEKERYDREVALARGVQRDLQPREYAKSICGIAVAGLNEMCEDATGDYYDCLIELPGERVAVVIGDVSGHGLQAALVMAQARAYLRAFVRTTDSVARVLQLLNESLVPDLSHGRFITLFAAVIDPDSGRTEWSNGGHNPPLLRRADGRVEELRATDPLIGILAGHAYRPGEPFTMEPEDALLLYTDGVTEARDADDDMFEMDRLRDALLAATGDAVDTIHSIRAVVREWTGDRAIDDDVTMMVVKRVR
ncbi:MAG: PP2C family protein-serine/threonine phosphatase [Planctomycetota bacterium]